MFNYRLPREDIGFTISQLSAIALIHLVQNDVTLIGELGSPKIYLSITFVAKAKSFATNNLSNVLNT